MTLHSERNWVLGRPQTAPCPARHSNLGGTGPDAGPEMMLFTRVGTQANGAAFDVLIVEARGPYATRRDQRSPTIAPISDLSALNGCADTANGIAPFTQYHRVRDQSHSENTQTTVLY